MRSIRNYKYIPIKQLYSAFFLLTGMPNGIGKNIRIPIVNKGNIIARLEYWTVRVHHFTITGFKFKYAIVLDIPQGIASGKIPNPIIWCDSDMPVIICWQAFFG